MIQDDTTCKFKKIQIRFMMKRRTFSVFFWIQSDYFKICRYHLDLKSSFAHCGSCFGFRARKYIQGPQRSAC